VETDMRPHTPQEVKRWAHGRRPHERERPPEPGERLLLREADFADPVPAIVAAVQDLTTPGDHWRQHGQLVQRLGPGMPDPSVWTPEYQRDAAGNLIYDADGDPVPTGRWLPHDDPWPWVHVQVIVHEGGGPPDLAPPRWCKEARVRGSAGWMRPGSRAHTGNYEEG
jgi:hypothetical protein